MVGRVINRVRNLWILVISLLLLIGVIAAVFVFTSKQETKIPQKGVFVISTLEFARSFL